MTAWNDDGTGLRKNGEQWVRVSIHQATVRHTRLEPTDNHRMHYLPLANGSGHPRCLFDNQSVQASLCIRRITYGSPLDRYRCHCPCLSTFSLRALSALYVSAQSRTSLVHWMRRLWAKVRPWNLLDERLGISAVDFEKDFILRRTTIIFRLFILCKK